MFILVQGCNDGHDGRLRARRYFSNGAPTRLEVLDTQEDPPDVDRIVNGKAVGKMPDPARIGQKSLAELKSDSCIRYQADGATSDGIARQKIEDATRIAGEKAAALVAAEIENETLRKHHEVLTAESGELKSKLAALVASASADKESAAGLLTERNLEIKMLTEENERLVAEVAALKAARVAAAEGAPSTTPTKPEKASKGEGAKA